MSGWDFERIAIGPAYPAIHVKRNVPPLGEEERSDKCKPGNEAAEGWDRDSTSEGERVREYIRKSENEPVKRLPIVSVEEEWGGIFIEVWRSECNLPSR